MIKLENEIKDKKIKNNSINPDISKDVKAEEKRLLKLISGLDEAKKEFNTNLIKNIAFQGVMLNYLKEQIATNGVKETYQNGLSQYGTKETIEVKTYNSMIKNYANCIKQVNELLIKCGNTNLIDEFDAFNE